MPEELDRSDGPINVEQLLLELRDINLKIPHVKPTEIQEQLRESAKKLRAKLEELFKRIENDHERRVHLTQALERASAEIERLTAPPLPYGYVDRIHDDGTIDVFINKDNRRRVNVSPEVNVKELKTGQRALLSNINYTILEIDEEWEKIGEEGKVSALLGEDIVRVVTHLDEVHDVILAAPLREQKIREGDSLLIFGNFAFAKLPKAETDELLLEKVPEIGFAQIGGLKNQVEILLEAIEYPALYPELFALHKLKPTKGVLLYGPPGCGKTLLAKAVANLLAQKTRKKIGDANICAYFINIKGPELLNKWVGETERKIREVFQRAREKAVEGSPVIIFFDEFDSLFRTRGSGISSDIESTVVPQFLSMLDGAEELNNVIVIGASNRQDLIDPAILRPGRFDIKIKVDRPDELGAKEILGIYVTPDLPWGEDSEGKSYVGQKFHSVVNRLHGNKPYSVDLSTPELVVEHMIKVIVEYLYYVGPPIAWTDRRGNQHEYNTECIEITWADGERKMLYVKDILVSGAMIESIVNRVKKIAIKRAVTGKGGIKMVDFYTAIRDEIKESSDLPNTNNPDDWAKIIGQRSESGQRIVNVRPIIGTQRVASSRSTEHVVTTGQYL
ncbi:MAG: proteasome ATPase [Parcubacteria group bacterium]|nr:proteasome ATPase [Parcubacteria group bacterium]